MGEPENGHPNPLEGVPFPASSREAQRRIVVERRTQPAAPTPPPEPSIDDAERIAAVARELHSAALARGCVRRISVTIDIVNGRPRARCVSLIKETTEVPLDCQPKRSTP